MTASCGYNTSKVPPLNVGQPRRNGAGEVGSGASDLPDGVFRLADLVFEVVTSPRLEGVA
jgi:hypothetical protein